MGALPVGEALCHGLAPGVGGEEGGWEEVVEGEGRGEGGAAPASLATMATRALASAGGRRQGAANPTSLGHQPLP